MNGEAPCNPELGPCLNETNKQNLIDIRVNKSNLSHLHKVLHKKKLLYLPIPPIFPPIFHFQMREKRDPFPEIFSISNLFGDPFSTVGNLHGKPNFLNSNIEKAPKKKVQRKASQARKPSLKAQR